ncbi:MAG: hypothetical protein BJ554DRAFT_6221, partial [Olpidium bornovanus]
GSAAAETPNPGVRNTQRANPVILFAGSIYFAFANIVFRYQFAFANVRKYEKAGRLWMQMADQIHELGHGLQVAPDLDEGHMGSGGVNGDSRFGAVPSSDLPTTVPERHVPRDVRPGAREDWGRRIIEEAEALELLEAAEAAASGFSGLLLPRISILSPAASYFRRAPSDPNTSPAAALGTGAFESFSSSRIDPDGSSPVEQASGDNETIFRLNIQDESSSNQTSTHPCLIERLPTLLWLPLNPLNQKLDPDHTTQIGQAIVSSEALKGTGRFRAAEKFRRDGAFLRRPSSIGIAMGVTVGREMAEGVVQSRDGREVCTDSAEPRPPSTFQTRRRRRRRRRSGPAPVLSSSPSPASILLPEVGLLADLPLLPASVSRGDTTLWPSSADAAADLASYKSPSAVAASATSVDSLVVPDIDILEGGGSAASVLSRPASAAMTGPGPTVARATEREKKDGNL